MFRVKNHLINLSLRSKVTLALTLSILIILGSVIIGPQWKFLQYRFFILTPDSTLKQNVKYVVGSAIDAAISNGNSIVSLFESHNPPIQSNLKTLNIRVARGSLTKMASQLPASAKERYYPAWFLYPDGQWKRMEYRFRGRNIWHWHPEKPSLRLKLKKKYPLSLQRNLNLVNPEDRAMVSNALGNEIGFRMGVLTQVTEHIRLFINKNYFGVYHLETREDEEMLRFRHRIPGPLFIGDHLKRPWKADQFELAGETKSLSQFNPMSQLIEVLDRPPNPEVYQKLWNIFDFDKLARWQATLNIVGGIHTDYHHNHLYYFDPALGLLEPIVSDINGHGLLTPVRENAWDRVRSALSRGVSRYDIPLNEKLHPLIEMAYKNPFFYHHRNEILYDAIMAGPGSFQEQSKILNGFFDKMDPDVKADRHKGALESAFVGWFRIPYNNFQYKTAKKNIYKWIQKRNEFLLKELKKSSLHVQLEERTKDPKLLVTVYGNSSVSFDLDSVEAHFHAHLPHQSTPQRVKGPQILYPGLKKDYEFKYQPTEGRRTTPYYLFPGQQSYLFTLSPFKSPKILKQQIEKAFTHSLTKERISFTLSVKKSISTADVNYNEHSIHPWSFDFKRPGDIMTLGPGPVKLERDLIIDEDSYLTVKAGTTLQLGEGVSIASKGKVLFQGTKEAPIYIKRLIPTKPWGAVIIQGPKSKGSQISFTHISGGSLDHLFNVHYSGMLSIHGSDNFEIHDSSLERNVLSDDTLHIIYGRAQISNLTFRDCFADCIDLDYVDASLKNIFIANAGNDGIDLMTSKVTMENINIKEAGDKGFSLGELSQVKLVGSTVQRALIAIAVKDGTQAYVSDTVLENNEVAFDLYKKNWRYGGPGKLEIKDVLFKDNQVNLRVEEGGEVILNQEKPNKVVGDGTIHAAL